MTILVVIYQIVNMQNNFQWPCSMCPSPSSDLWGGGLPIFLIFPGHPEFWTPLQILLLGAPWLHPLTLLYPRETQANVCQDTSTRMFKAAL